MGEATYYMKGYNCNDDATFERIWYFMREGSEAEDWWQDHRHYEREKRRDRFWEEFDKKFPHVSDYLKFIKKHGGDCSNDLAGYLDFGVWEDDQDNLKRGDGDEIRYNAYVWHFADWDGLCKYIEKTFGLTNVRWLSDEHTESLYDLL